MAAWSRATATDNRMPTIGASIAATLASWLVDALISSFAGIYVRALVGLAVSIWVFYVARKWLLDLRGY